MSERRSPASPASWVWFSLLALYGTLRWATMLPGTEQGRLFVSFLVTVGCAVAVRLLLGGRRRRWAIAPVIVLGLAVLLAIAGFPLAGLLRLHTGDISSDVSDGISSLSGLLVPYTGTDPDTTAVIVLGAALLLLCAGLVFGTVRGAPGTGRLAFAAVPLLVLAVVPSAIVTPRLVYFHGLITFALLALLVFSPRMAPARRGAASTFLVLAGVIGAVGAGVLVGDRVWIHTDTGPHGAGTAVLTGTADEFDWEQTYGDQDWPHDGATVMTVSAARPALWKAEDLDAFDGTAWTTGTGELGGGLTGVTAAHLARYSELLGVNVDQLSSSLVIAAGYAGDPNVVGTIPGTDPGTWRTRDALVDGETYQVQAYVPTPPASELAAAGTDYPAALTPFRTVTGLSNAYSGVEALAHRLDAGTNSPYAYVQAVLTYLSHGYVYTLKPPVGGRYPLVDFLLHNRSGYCQQFAGATALLLRLGGVPARVAVGFSTGTREGRTDTYRVSDRDAHAWVEAWFPSFGWVTFDPTPGQAVAGASATTGPRGTSAAAAAAAAAAAQSDSTTTSVDLAGVLAQQARERLAHAQQGGSAGPAAKAGAAGAPVLEIILGILAVLGLATVAVGVRAFWRRPSPAQLIAELDRAFAHCGRPLGADVTLAALGRRLADSPPAAGYVAALAATRYEGYAAVSTAGGRAALRRWLAAGLGPRGWLRALRALPPRRSPGVAP